MLKQKGLATGLGDEGGFAPNLDSNRAALDLIAEAVAAAGLHARHRHRAGAGRRRQRVLRGRLLRLRGRHQVGRRDDRLLRRPGRRRTRSCRIEDPLDEDDWDGWKTLTDELGDRVQIVGDDLFVTNVERLQRGIDGGQANALLVKVNQIGSLTETLDSVDLAHRNGYRCMMSHRSGETEDTTIADLAVATNCGQIKTGAPARSERVAKYNQLLRIEEELGDAARYAGARRLPAVRGLSAGCPAGRVAAAAAPRARAAARARARGGPRPRPRRRAAARRRPPPRRHAAESRFTGRAMVLVLVLSVLTISYASSLQGLLPAAQPDRASCAPRSPRARRASTSSSARSSAGTTRPTSSSRPARASAT